MRPPDRCVPCPSGDSNGVSMRGHAIVGAEWMQIVVLQVTGPKAPIAVERFGKLGMAPISMFNCCKVQRVFLLCYFCLCSLGRVGRSLSDKLKLQNQFSVWLVEVDCDRLIEAGLRIHLKIRTTPSTCRILVVPTTENKPLTLKNCGLPETNLSREAEHERVHGSFHLGLDAHQFGLLAD